MDLVLSEQQRVGTIYFMMDEPNVRLQLQQSWMKFGTDAGGIDPDSARGLTHPRAYGTFTRILGKYVREEQVIPLEDASAQDDVCRGHPAVRARPWRPAARLFCRHHNLRREYHCRPGHVRAAAPACR